MLEDLYGAGHRMVIRSEGSALLLLCRVFSVLNWFYTWLLYLAPQIFSSIAITLLFDTKTLRLSRTLRAVRRAHLGLPIPKYLYPRERASPPPRKRWSTSWLQVGGLDGVVLYIFCGMLDAMWQTTAYWMFAAMSNDRSSSCF